MKVRESGKAVGGGEEGKDAEVVIPTTVPSHAPIRLLQKTGGSWRMIVGYYKLNQVVTLIAASIPDAVSLRK